MLVPDYIGKVAGFREWCVYIDNNNRVSLHALYSPVEWTKEPLKFKCLCKCGYTGMGHSAHALDEFRTYIELVGPEHEYPTRESDCGLYAMEYIRWLNPWLGCDAYDCNKIGESTSVYTIKGVSSHWGQIVLGEDGLKSEYAQIEAFFEPKEGFYHPNVLNQVPLEIAHHHWKLFEGWVKENRIPIFNIEGDEWASGIDYDMIYEFTQEKGLICQEDIKYQTTSEK